MMKSSKDSFDAKLYNKQIDGILSALKTVTFPILPKQYSIKGVSHEITRFHELLKQELQKMNLGDSQATSHIQSAENNSKRIYKDFGSLKKSLKNKQKITPHLTKKMDDMANAIDELSKQMQEMDEAQEQFSKKVYAHESNIKKIVDKHRENMNNAVDANSNYIKDIQTFIKDKEKAKQVNDAIRKDKGRRPVMQKQKIKKMLEMEKKYAK